MTLRVALPPAEIDDGITVAEAARVLICDDGGRMACEPYDQDALHQMASELGIGRLWFRGGPRGHYNVPRRLHDKVAATARVVSAPEFDRIMSERSTVPLPEPEIDEVAPPDEDEEWRSSFDLDKVGIVYVIQALEKTPVKIGFCSFERGLPSRLQQLQTGNPYPLRVLTHAPGSIRDERTAHAALAPERLSGEWFQWTSRTIAFIDHLAAFRNIARSIEGLRSLEVSDVPLDWENLIVSESAAESVFSLSWPSTPRAARLASKPPPFDERTLSNGRFQRFYKLSDLKRWLVANDILHSIDRLAWRRYVRRIGI